MASLRTLVVCAFLGCILANTVSAQAAGNPLSPIVNAVGNLLTNIITIVKQLLDQLLPTINNVLQNV
uniref:Uncharacterized protein n=1 Tax=Acrobeloides nanus TaxID=290746 RepID=A0A914CP44_9BILA